MAGCCRFQTFLVLFQVFLGLAITGLCTYLHLSVDVVTLRDKPFWAGVPLLLAGLLGTSFIGHSKNQYGSSSTCRFACKVVSVIMAVVALFACLTSSVFESLHLYRLLTYSHCMHSTNGCLCFKHVTQTEGGHLYSPVPSCHVLFCEIKIYFFVTGGLCLVAGFVTVIFLVSVWRSVYGSTSPPPVTTASPRFRYGLTES